MPKNGPTLTAGIALGANLGDRAVAIESALDQLDRVDGVHVTARSLLHETTPVGGPSDQPMYLNAAALIETTRAPRDLLEVLLEIEREAGRERRERWGPRVIDLDLIFYGDLILDEPGLHLPHPRMHERLFVLAPLAEIVPDFVHPQRHQTTLEMLEALRNPA